MTTTTRTRLSAKVSAVLDAAPFQDCTPVLTQPPDRPHLLLIGCTLDEFWHDMSYTSQDQLVHLALDHWWTALDAADLDAVAWWGLKSLEALIVTDIADPDQRWAEVEWAKDYLDREDPDGER